MIGQGIMKKLKSGKKYSSSPLGQGLMSIAMMHVPKLSMEAAERIIPLIIASFLADCDIPVLENIGSITPSANNLKTIMMDETVDTILLDKMEMRGKPLVLMCNKGDGDGR